VTDARRFYTETIPAQFNSVLEAQEQRGDEDRRLLEGMRAADATIRVDVTGEGGGRFFLNLRGGVMTAGDAPDHTPFLTLVQDRTAFERLAEEAGGSAVALLGGLAGLPGDLKLTRSRIENLGAVKGLVRFEVTGERGFALLTHFGGGAIPAAPDASIRVDEATYERLREGRIDPTQALADGSLGIDGDVELVVQLALAAIAPD
jgi:hypothetical protein